MLRRPSTAIKWIIALTLITGFLGFLPAASYLYAEFAGYQFTPWVWLAGLQYQMNQDALLLAALGGATMGIGVPAFVVWALLPQKPLHGSARLARTGEIAQARLYQRGDQSILLGRHQGRLLAFNGDLHPFLAAATGTGKGVGFVIPNLLHWRGSVLVLDIKGENYKITSGYRAEVLKQPVFRFDPLQEQGQTHAFNPLAYVREGDLRVTDVQTIASILVPNESQDPYWDSVARDLFVGLALLVLEAGPDLGWPVTIGQVHRLLRSEEESGAYLQALLDDLSAHNLPLSSLCRRYILSFCNEPEKPRGSIKSALATRLTLWANPLIDRATSRNDFDLRRFRCESMSLFIAIAPDELQRLAPIVRLLLEFFLTTNTKIGETPQDNPGLRVPVLVLLDEFLSLGRMDKLVHALSYVRGWGIRMATVIQSEAQLQALYGRELAEFFVDNHRARVYYRPPLHRRDLAEQIAKIVGLKTVQQTSYSYGNGRRSRQVSHTGQYVLEAEEIAHLRADETIVLVDGVRPMIGRKLRYYNDRYFKARLRPTLSLPAPLTLALPDAPSVAVSKAEEGRVPGIERNDGPTLSTDDIQGAIEAIETPAGVPSDADLLRMASELAAITLRAPREALAGLPG